MANIFKTTLKKDVIADIANNGKREVRFPITKFWATRLADKYSLDEKTFEFKTFDTLELSSPSNKDTDAMTYVFGFVRAYVDNDEFVVVFCDITDEVNDDAQETNDIEQIEFLQTEICDSQFSEDNVDFIETLDLTPNDDFYTYDGSDVYFSTNNDEVVVCGNNPLYLPDEPLYDWYAGFSEDIDVSMYFQLINSRNIPALMAESDAKAKQIKTAFEKIKAGVPVVITTDMFDNTELLDPTDKALIEKMQYLSSFYGEMDKRFANLRGIDVNTLDKRAQVTSSELNQFSDVTSNNFLAMYEARLEFCEKMRDIYGIEIECVRNPIYADEPKQEEIESEEAQEEAAEENVSEVEENVSEVKDETEVKEDETV